MLVLLIGYSCDTSCDKNAPTPISLNLQWVNGKGVDVFQANKKGIDSVKYLVYTKFDTIEKRLPCRIFKDSTLFYFDALPALKLVLANKLDTFYIKVDNSQKDTIVAKAKNINDPCYSAVYHFEKLTYNGQKLSGLDSLYIIQK